MDPFSGRNDTDPRDPYDRLMPRLYMSLVAGGLMSYVALALSYPVAWGILSIILFGFGAGLFTGKIIFNFQHAALIWGAAPVFGTAWMLFFWALFRVMRYVNG